MPEDNVMPQVRKDYIRSMAAKGSRADGRGLEEVRELTVDKGVITTADGSARVRLGRTQVVVGVKMEVGRPYADAPDRGVLSTHSELVPLASPGFDNMPHSPMSVELARVVDRGVRGSDCIDLGKLVIEPGEKVWTVYVDLHVVDFDGNLIDASGIGVMAALACTRVPASRFGLGQDFDLPVKRLPVPVTMVKIGDSLLVDPNMDEESVADARLTVTTDDGGDIRAMQKALSGGMTAEEVARATALSREVGRRLRERLS